MEEKLIEFYKKMGLYNEELFNKIKENTVVISSGLSEFYGIFENNEIVLPKVNSIKDELIWVHEYAHIINLEGGELFANIMESEYINMYIEDKTPIIEETIKEIERSKSEEHTLAKKVKLSRIR